MISWLLGFKRPCRKACQVDIGDKFIQNRFGSQKGARPLEASLQGIPISQATGAMRIPQDPLERDGVPLQGRQKAEDQVGRATRVTRTISMAIMLR